jgi:hypothetical protein
MAVGGGYQHSDQQSSSTSGISRQYKDALSADAYNQSQLYGRQAQEFFQSPFGYFQNQNIRSLIPQNEFGLPIQTTQALNALANNWYSRASAGGAMRGQVTPENTNQVVGSALLNGAQWLIPQITQNQQYLAELPDKLMASRLGYLQSDLATKAGLLGSTSDYRGSGEGVHFNYATMSV